MTFSALLALDQLRLLPDRVDLLEARPQLLNGDFGAHIARLIVVELVLNAQAMEGMLAGEDVELLFEDGLEAEVTRLRRTDHDALVLHLPLLVPELLRILRKIIEVRLQRFNLDLIVTKAVTEVVLHVLDLFIGWEERQEIVDLQLGIIEYLQSLIDTVLLHRGFVVLFISLSTQFGVIEQQLSLILILLLALVAEEVLCNLHPKLLPDFLVVGLIGVLLGHVDVVALKCDLNSLIKMVEDCIDNDLGLLHHVDLPFQPGDFFLVFSVHWIVFVLMVRHCHSFDVETINVLILLLFADIECVVNFEVDRMPFTLFDLFTFQKANHSIGIIDLGMEEESHIVNGLRSIASPGDAVVGNVLQSNPLILFILNVHECRHQFWNVYFLVLLPLQICNRRLSTFVQEY